MSYEWRVGEQRGMAVVTVLLIIVVLLILGTALVAVAISHAQMTVNTEARQQAYNAAESGLADVAEQIQNGTITATQVGSGTSTNGVQYNWTVTFNPTATPTAAPNPLNPVPSCNALSTTQPDPGPGCVAIAPGSAFIAVTASLSGHDASVEAMATPGQDFKLGKWTVALVGMSTSQPQYWNIYASDVTFNHFGIGGSSSTENDANVISDGNWYAWPQYRIDGTAAVVGSINQANAKTKLTGAPSFSFPSASALQRAQVWWIKQAKADNCYLAPPQMGQTMVVPRGAICYVNGSVYAAYNGPIINDGGLLVVSGHYQDIRARDDQNGGYRLTAACQSSCDCHKRAQVVVLSQGPPAPFASAVVIVARSSQGYPTGNVVPEALGVFYSPNAPINLRYMHPGWGVFLGVLAAQGVLNAWQASVQVDPCALNAAIRMGAFQITAFGQD